jgi:hypothetical protein
VGGGLSGKSGSLGRLWGCAGVVMGMFCGKWARAEGEGSCISSIGPTAIAVRIMTGWRMGFGVCSHGSLGLIATA